MSTLRRGLQIAGFLLLTTASLAQVRSQVIQSEELENFLKKAKIVRARDIPAGVALPKKLTLELDGVTRSAAYKSIHEVLPVKELTSGREFDFRDSYTSEVAAYEVDKIIGLGMVPTTVARTFDGKPGSAQFWVDSMMEEGDRQKKNIQPPDVPKWNQNLRKRQLFDNLIYNTDRNQGNQLITKDWEIILIDHSRSFKNFSTLKDPKVLARFSKSLLEGILRLNEKNLSDKTGKYLSKDQIKAVLKRRDLIVALAAKLVAEKGEGEALDP